jgi:UDP-N-acetylglucosamine--N-acetylmuramyl-(pentapeptide) pyrophosphoryl-undecaprenol N-acetylglucosamine transferase
LLFGVCRFGFVSDFAPTGVRTDVLRISDLLFREVVRLLAGPIYIFAGGGTGGHLYPGLAVAERLIQLRGDARVVFACSNRDIDRRILSATQYTFVPQPVRPLPRGWRGWWSFLRGWWGSKRIGRRLLREYKPAGVLGLGGFAAGPLVKAASEAHLPVGMISIDAVPGIANRHLARKAQAVFAQFRTTGVYYGRQAGKVRVVGCPVRQGLLRGRREEALPALGLRDDRRTLVIVAGSLGAATINEAIMHLAADFSALAEQWQVLHVTGPGKIDRVRQVWDSGKVHAVVMEFCQRMDLAYAAADLVLCRAGASTIGELSAVGVPAVLMPYPFHADQQQRHNSEALAAAGAAVMVIDQVDATANAHRLREVLIDLLRDPAKLAAMRSAATALHQDDAADAIAKWLLEVSGQLRGG